MREPPVAEVPQREQPRPVRALVAGGAGFLGSHLVEVLLADGCHVTVLDSYVTSTPRNLQHLRRHPRLRTIEQDVRELALTARPSYDRVYHLASPASPDDYTREPVMTLLTNATGTWRLLERARRCGARFLLASTSEVYGDPLEHPQRESYRGNVDPIGPRSAYDEGKRFAEALTVAYAREHAMDTRIVRIFNCYGPRMRPDDGRMPSAFITAALSGRPLVVHGSGGQTRSLCYVADTARGLVAAMERGRPGGVYNVGSPDEMSVREFARKVRELTRSQVPIRSAPARPDDVRRRRPDIALARRELGWAPTTTLDDGLRETVGWYVAQLRRGRAATRRRRK